MDWMLSVFDRLLRLELGKMIIFVEKLELVFEIFGFCAYISQNLRPFLSENKPKSSTTDASNKITIPLTSKKFNCD